MLVYRTIAEKVFWDFDSIIVQKLRDILPLFCTPRIIWLKYKLPPLYLWGLTTYQLNPKIVL